MRVSYPASRGRCQGSLASLGFISTRFVCVELLCWSNIPSGTVVFYRTSVIICSAPAHVALLNCSLNRSVDKAGSNCETGRLQSMCLLQPQLGINTCLQFNFEADLLALIINPVWIQWTTLDVNERKGATGQKMNIYEKAEMKWW